MDSLQRSDYEVNSPMAIWDSWWKANLTSGQKMRVSGLRSMSTDLGRGKREGRTPASEKFMCRASGNREAEQLARSTSQMAFQSRSFVVSHSKTRSGFSRALIGSPKNALSRTAARANRASSRNEWAATLPPNE